MGRVDSSTWDMEYGASVAYKQFKATATSYKLHWLSEEHWQKYIHSWLYTPVFGFEFIILSVS